MTGLSAADYMNQGVGGLIESSGYDETVDAIIMFEEI